MNLFLTTRRALMSALCGLLVLGASARAQVVLQPDNIQLFGTGSVQAFARQADGKVIVGGEFSSVEGLPRVKLARLNADGTLDVAWQADLDRFDTVTSIVIDQAGYAIVGGAISSVRGLPRTYLARLSPIDGTPDPAWKPQPNNYVSSLALDAGGAVLVAGSFTTIDGEPRLRLAKVGANGILDPSWHPSPDAFVATMATDDLGNVFIGGSFVTVDGVERSYLAKIDVSSGVVDPIWNPGSNSEVQHLAYGIEPVGGSRFVFASGSFSVLGGQTQLTVGRVNAGGDGSAPSPTPDPTGAAGTVTALATDAAGWLYVGSNTGQSGIQSLRRLAMTWDSTADSAWAPAVTEVVNQITVLPDLRIAVGGGFHSAGGTRSGAFAVLDHDTGSASGIWAWVERAAVVNAMVRDSHDRLILAGDFSRIAGGPRRRSLLRINADNSVDESWAAEADGAVTAMTIGPDDTLYIAGTFSHVTDAFAPGLARLDSSGALDSNWGTTYSGIISRMLLDPVHDRLYVAGSFAAIGDNVRYSIARLSTLANGSVDPVWNPAPAYAGDYSDSGTPPGLALTDDALFYCSSFTELGGQFTNGIARISTEGSGAVDPLWNPRPDLSVTALLADGNGKLYLGGYFETLGGVTRPHIARVSTSGSGDLDQGWYPGLARSPGTAMMQNVPVPRKPSIPSNAGVHVLVLANSVLWVGGSYIPLLNAYHSLARIASDGTGLVDPNFNPPLSPDATIFAILPRQDGTIEVAGDFTTIAGVPRRGYARLGVTPKAQKGLDVDGSGGYEALSDGLIILRYLFGNRGYQMAAGSTGPNSTQSYEGMEAYLATIKSALDVDGDGQSDALTDGLLILRYLSGSRGNVLINGVVGAGSSRTASEIETAIQTLMP